MNTNNLSDQQIFTDLILPRVKENFPDSKIIALKRVRDGFRVGFIRTSTDPNSGMIQTWMIINNEAVLISEN
jgi:hypothetical protein